MVSYVDEPRGMKTFLIIWAGQIISIVGSGLTSFALGVWIFEQTREATPFALVVLIGNLPRILLSPVAGALVDRWNRRWVMILADTGNALVTLGVVVLLSIGDLDVWHIYAIALLTALFAAFQEPAYIASTTLLVPKQDLARASGLMQMGQAAEMLVSPILAGALFAVVGLQGIVVIDFVTFFFAISALLIVRIPQPEAVSSGGQARRSVWQDALFGWRYLRSRAGLFGLLLYFALVNFLLNFAAVLTGPLVLSFSTSAALGVVQTVSGVGMLVGSIVMSAWGGPQRRIRAVIGFIGLASLGLLLIGLQPSVVLICAGFFVLLFCVPLASGPSQAIFQTKVAPDVQGRVFAIRSMISRSMMPLAFLLAGPLADRVFGPLMSEGGALANTALGSLIGVGPGRGIGLMFVLSATTLALVTALVYASPRIRHIEDELPDAIPDTAAHVPASGEDVARAEPVSTIAS
jgi:hypothetical protein